jgi:hypothetical protein
MTLDFTTLRTVDVLTLSASAVALLFSAIALWYTRLSARAAEKAADATVAAANAAERQAAAAERAETHSSGQTRAERLRRVRKFEANAKAIMDNLSRVVGILKSSQTDQVFAGAIVNKAAWEELTASALEADALLDAEDLMARLIARPSLVEGQPKFAINSRNQDEERLLEIIQVLRNAVDSLYTSKI